MTTASTPSDDGSKVVSTEYAVRFITAREVARLDEDSVLDAGDVWGRSA